MRFGGHKYAAGLSLKKENLASFKEDFENEVGKHIQEKDLIAIKMETKIATKNDKLFFENLDELLFLHTPNRKEHKVSTLILLP